MDKKTEEFEQEIKHVVMRGFIASRVENFDPSKTYIIYDSKDIEEFNREVFNLKRRFKSFDKYAISEPKEMIQ